jgi:hypothetical protein
MSKKTEDSPPQDFAPNIPGAESNTDDSPPLQPAIEPEPRSLRDADEYTDDEMDMTRRAYRRFWETLAVRQRPNDPEKWDELTTERRLGWLRAVCE